MARKMVCAALICTALFACVLVTLRPPNQPILETLAPTHPPPPPPPTNSPPPPPPPSLVYWAPRLLDDRDGADPTAPATWWADGLELTCLSLLSTLLAGERDANRWGDVHFLIVSNVDEGVLKSLVARFVTVAAPWVPPERLAAILHVWRVPAAALGRFQTKGCAKWALRGEIPAYPHVTAYAHVLYLDVDVVVKRPLADVFRAFAAFVVAEPSEREKLHAVPETAAFWSQEAYTTNAGWSWFSTGAANASDVASRGAHFLRPFNSGILLFATSPALLQAIQGCQDTIRQTTHECRRTDQPFFNEYFATRLLSSWRFLCGRPTVAELLALAQNHTNPAALQQSGDSEAGSLCGRHDNRAMLFMRSFYGPLPLQTDGHALVHLVFPSDPAGGKKAEFYRFLDAYFPSTTTPRSPTPAIKELIAKLQINALI